MECLDAYYRAQSYMVKIRQELDKMKVAKKELINKSQVPERQRFQAKLPHLFIKQKPIPSKTPELGRSIVNKQIILREKEVISLRNKYVRDVNKKRRAKTDTSQTMIFDSSRRSKFSEESFNAWSTDSLDMCIVFILKQNYVIKQNIFESTSQLQGKQQIFPQG
ncbi:hypothetical protein pb186bvf_004024 [Paramecium bursaria]